MLFFVFWPYTHVGTFHSERHQHYTIGYNVVGSEERATVYDKRWGQENLVCLRLLSGGRELLQFFIRGVTRF